MVTASHPPSTHVEKYGLKFKYGSRHAGLGKHDLHYGDNSGYQAVNLAYLFGARRIVLLGYDMRPGTDGRSHWHPQHKNPLNPGGTDVTRWAQLFHELAKDLASEGVEVINCTRRTALTCFPQLPLEAL